MQEFLANVPDGGKVERVRENDLGEFTCDVFKRV